MHYSKYDESNEKIAPSEDLAYWVGVAQTDAYLKKVKDKRYNTNKIKYIVRLGIVKSIPMLEKFREISNNSLFRKGVTWKNKKNWLY